MEALRMIREAIPDWDDRIEKDKMKQTVKEAPMLAGHGGDRKGEEHNQDAIGKLKAGSNSSSYLASRLKRDAPEIAKRLGCGEFKSVRAAAIEAGIVKPKSQLDIAKSAWKRMNDSERTEFLSRINEV